MKKVASIAGALLLGAFAIAFWGYRVSPTEVLAHSNLQQLQVRGVPDTQSWQQTFKRVPDYMSKQEAIALEKARAEQAKQEHNSSAASKASPTLDAALLIGIVQETPARVMLLLPGASEPTVLHVGESWLPPWQLENIGLDVVLWRNQETNEALKQFVFR